MHPSSNINYITKRIDNYGHMVINIHIYFGSRTDDRGSVHGSLLLY